MTKSQNIAPNTTVSHYRIVAKLGAGGMGEVYRARDERLGRDVAIKVLPLDFAKDEDRLRRFEQEARATSALNHPNILTVYDIGTHAGSPYIVAELLEGAELRDQLNDGPIPQRRAVDYAQQIASGLAAAHSKSIIHRDLKPENIFITADGRLKILDFGLAKLNPPKQAAGASSEVVTQKGITDPGTLMGTVGYMSPEQVRGQVADHRSDIFSFGVILYEMLSGRRTFNGDSAIEVMNAILKEEPKELTETDSKTSPALERIVCRCLEKTPERRFQSASDLSFAIEALSTSSGPRLDTSVTTALTGGADKRLWRGRIPWFVAAAALVTALGFAWAYIARKPENAEARVMKLSISPPDKSSFDTLALSPDGRWLAFTAATGGTVQLWVRALDATESKVLAGTEGARLPFWSPDSHWIGFFSGGKLKKIEVSGGPAQPVCDAPSPAGGSWNRHDLIIFSGLGGLFKVPASGGEEATSFTVQEEDREETTHLARTGLPIDPCFLPDGQRFLYTISSGRKETRGIYVGSLDGKVNQRLLGDYSSAIYAPPGFLLFRREEALMAQAFDAGRFQLSGAAFQVAERIESDPVRTDRLNASASDNGVLVIAPYANRRSAQLIWLDRGGKQIGSLGKWNSYSRPSLSPDEKRLAIERRDTNGTFDLWLADVSGANATRFTFDPGSEVLPVWSPDGSRIAFSSNREGGIRMYQKAVSGASREEPLLNVIGAPLDWSHDGRFIIYVPPASKLDVWVLPVDGVQPPFPLLQTEALESGAELSPDMRWVAYDSDESGTLEVYIQRFPTGGGKRQISTGGGLGPHWRGDGRELFYYSADGKLMALPVTIRENLETGAAVALFEFRSASSSGSIAPYTATRDGQRFLLNAIVDTDSRALLSVVVNWTAELKK